jgi:hypothetical protein
MILYEQSQKLGTKILVSIFTQVIKTQMIATVIAVLQRKVKWL